MTFRPSDDVLDEKMADQQVSLNQNDVWTQENGQSIFKNTGDFSSNWIDEGLKVNQAIIDIPVEEVKAPDISELLKDSWGGNMENEVNDLQKVTENVNNVQNLENIEKDLGNVTIKGETHEGDINNKSDELDEGKDEEKSESSIQKEDLYATDSDEITDEERSSIVSWMEGAINSNLDLLVDHDWFDLVKQYKNFNRLFFRWWFFAFSVIIGIVSWIFLQTKIGSADNIEMVKESSVENKSKRRDETPDKVLLPLIESWVKIDVWIPYWVVSLSWTSFYSKSNLILYKWVVLPQLAVVDYDSEDFISLKDFNEKKLKRKDIVNLMNSLIVNNDIYKNTANISNVQDLRWISNDFWWSLEKYFNISCINNSKLSDFVCDKFLEIFNDYGKYYDLGQGSIELLDVVKNLKKKKEDIEPICDMVKEYTLHVGSTTGSLLTMMELCSQDESEYYKKLVNFIDLENSLGQPELSSKVFDNPDLNAYKLLSAQQTVYKILWWTSLNEGYIKSYLAFVQTLLDRDKGSNRYLHPIYKDLLYVFNMDELYQGLINKWKLSSDIKLQIDQINNWSSLWSISLISQLTTADIVHNESDFTGMTLNEKTLEDLFSQYYAMNDRLKVRRADVVSDDTIKVQTEIFTDGTNWDTLKVTTTLRRQDNLLYVESIKVANQPKFTDILNIYLSEWNITFYAMLNYIDEQVWMWYESIPEKLEDQPTFCEKIMEREDIAVYTCDDAWISLYKWDVEYNFVLTNWVLDSFTISDEDLEQVIKSKLDGALFMKDSTPSIITSIIDFTIETEDGNLERKLEIIDQFRIHFKMVPDDIRDIEWKADLFLIDFTLWDFKLQGQYNVDTHVLTKISYTNCDKPLEIRQLSIEITSENEPQLLEILNNPRVFFATVSPSIYKKYQKACLGIVENSGK